MEKVIEEWQDENSPVDMEEGINDKNDDDNEKMMRKKRKMKQQIPKAPQLVKVKEWITKEVARMLF